jgi:epoxyqueuosine reductase
MTQSNSDQINADSDSARFIRQTIKDFVAASPAAGLPFLDGYRMYDEPLVRFADAGDDIFLRFKEVVGPEHLTPREAVALFLGKPVEQVEGSLSVISWILPITEETRKSNRREKEKPGRLWSHTRWYGENTNAALKKFLTELLTQMGQIAVAPEARPFFKMFSNARGPYSNWSERHIAFAAGQGTFSLSDGFITERGIAHRCGSVVTDLRLPASPRSATGPYSNCLAFAGVKCRACINRCPAQAITEHGHDKLKCQKYQLNLGYNVAAFMKDGYNNQTSVAGCGLCQTKVPCESVNPVSIIKKHPASRSRTPI